MADEQHDPGARVRILCEYGQNMTEVEDKIPASRYFKSGKELIRMASAYEEEGELEKAFILYNKFTTLFVEKLPKHPEYKSASSEQKKNTRKLLTLIFPKAEALKQKLKEKYTAEEDARQAKLKKEEEHRRQITEQQRIEAEARLQDESRRRLEAEQRLLRESEEQFRQLRMQEQAKLDQQQLRRTSSRDKSILNNVTTVTVSGPSAPPTPPADYFSGREVDSASFDGYAPGSPLPTVPPPSYTSVVQVDQKPWIPSRELKPTAAGAAAASFTPTIDRSLKPSVDHFTSVGDVGPKLLFIPDDLVPRFLHLAQANNAKLIETCGILCGRLRNSQ